MLTRPVFAKSGAAIIGGEVVPPAECKILRELEWHKVAVTVPQIAEGMANAMPDANIYTLLRRLQNRGLVLREVRMVEAAGRPVKRVFWSIDWRKYGSQ